MLPQRAGGLIGSHVPEGIGRLLCLAQASECRHVNAGAGRSRRTRGSGVSRGALQVGEMGRSDHQIGDQEAVYNQVTKERKKIVQQAQHTAGPASPERPRGPGGPMGPACPFNPSLPAGPVGPGGPYREKMRL